MVLAPLIIDLGFILTCLVAFALCLLAILLVRGLFGTIRGTIGWIPYLGRIVTAPIHSIEQKLIDVMNRAALGTQHRVGSAFHSLEHLTIQIGESIASAMELAYAVIVVVSTLPSWHTVKALYDSLVGRERATMTTIREHTKTIHANTRSAVHANQTATAAKVRAQAVPIDVVLPGDLAGIRARTRAVEDEIGRLWHRVRSFGRTAVPGVALGALAFALARLGIPWARCSNVDKVGRRLCRIDPNLLEALLFDTVAILGTVSVVEFIRDAQAIESVALDALGGFIREFPKV